MADDGRNRGQVLADLTLEVQQVANWIADRFAETAHWPTHVVVWREIARLGLDHMAVVQEGTQVFDHLGNSTDEREPVRLRPWVLFDTGVCGEAFNHAYEVYRNIQERLLHAEETVTFTRQQLAERFGLPFASKELHQLVWILSLGFGGKRCDGPTTDTDWSFTFPMSFLESPVKTLEEVFLRRPTIWIPGQAPGRSEPSWAVPTTAPEPRVSASKEIEAKLDRDLVAALETEVGPAVAACYRQAIADLSDPGRESFVGPAAELREVFAAVIYKLAPDDLVMAQPGWTTETRDHRPSRGQRIQFILGKRRGIREDLVRQVDGPVRGRRSAPDQ